MTLTWAEEAIYTNRFHRQTRAWGESGKEQEALCLKDVDQDLVHWPLWGVYDYRTESSSSGDGWTTAPLHSPLSGLLGHNDGHMMGWQTWRADIKEHRPSSGKQNISLPCPLWSKLCKLHYPAGFCCLASYSKGWVNELEMFFDGPWPDPIYSQSESGSDDTRPVHRSPNKVYYRQLYCVTIMPISAYTDRLTTLHTFIYCLHYLILHYLIPGTFD